MKTIGVSGWNPGFKKVSCTKLLQEKAGYSLSQAKATTDAILKRQRVIIELPERGLERTIAQLSQAGLVLRTKESDGTDLEARG
jgi:hypothetical protein